MNLLNLINSSLEVVYCSTPLSNHCIICLLDSSRDFTWGYGMNFVSYSHLILLISGQTLSVTVAPKKFWKLNGLLFHSFIHQSTSLDRRRLYLNFKILHQKISHQIFIYIHKVLYKIYLQTFYTDEL